jgi:hypothetical protein
LKKSVGERDGCAKPWESISQVRLDVRNDAQHECPQKHKHALSRKARLIGEALSAVVAQHRRQPFSHLFAFKRE